MPSKPRDTRTARQKWDQMMTEAYFRGYLFYEPHELHRIMPLLRGWHTDRPTRASARIEYDENPPLRERIRPPPGVQDNTQACFIITRTTLPPISPVNGPVRPTSQEHNYILGLPPLKSEVQRLPRSTPRFQSAYQEYLCDPIYNRGNRWDTSFITEKGSFIYIYNI